MTSIEKEKEPAKSEESVMQVLKAGVLYFALVFGAGFALGPVRILWVVLCPAQLVIYILGVSCIVLALRRGTWSSSIISLILSLLWLWMGVVYHFLFFSKINQAAWLFGALFILQSLIFVYAGFITRKLSFHVARDA